MPLGILCFQLVAHSFRKTWGWHGFLPIVVLDSRHPVPLSCSSPACPERSRRVAGRWSPACPERSGRVAVLHKSFRMRSSKSRVRNSFRMRSSKKPGAWGVLFSASGGGCGPREVQRRGASRILPLRFPVPFTTNENTHPVLRSAPALQTASRAAFLSASVPLAHRPEFPPRASAPPARSPE